MKNNGKYIVGLIILILVLVFGAGIIIVNRSSTARRIQVVYIPKARDDANDFWTSLLKGAQMAANEYDVDLTILAPDSEQDFEAQVRYIDEAIAMNPNAILLRLPVKVRSRRRRTASLSRGSGWCSLILNWIRTFSRSW